VIERIQKNAGGQWLPQTLDTFKAGDPEAQVKGIATTAMATMDVLTRASKENANLIVTLEPTFFGQSDGQPARPIRQGAVEDAAEGVARAA